MHEYDTWFELHAYDGFQWVFIADFDTREEAEEYAKMLGVMDDRPDCVIRKSRGSA